MKNLQHHVRIARNGNKVAIVNARVTRHLSRLTRNTNCILTMAWMNLTDTKRNSEENRGER